MAQGYTKGIPLSTDGTLSANSDLIVPSQKAVKTYVDANSGGGGGGTTTNALTINDSGSGNASGTTFNGSAAITISYNTIGAQASSSNLTNLSALTYASTSFVKMTGANTFTLDTNTYLTTSAAASTYQPIDADLTSWAGVTRASGFDTFAATPSSANLISLITDETGTGALVFANSPALSGTPTAPTATANDNSTKLATTAYVDNAVSAGGGLTFNQVQRIAFLKI
jgi:hypothetical protein